MEFVIKHISIMIVVLANVFICYCTAIQYMQVTYMHFTPWYIQPYPYEQHLFIYNFQLDHR